MLVPFLEKLRQDTKNEDLKSKITEYLASKAAEPPKDAPAPPSEGEKASEEAAAELVIDTASETKDKEELESGDSAWFLFKMALKDDITKLYALTCIQKLVSHLVIVGNGNPTELLALELKEKFIENQDYFQNQFNLEDLHFTTMDEIIFTIISVNSPLVFLQTIQFFLALVTGEQIISACSLLLILKECFRVYTDSKGNQTMETTAKAALTQMINMIFSKIEKYGAANSTTTPTLPATPTTKTVSHGTVFHEENPSLSTRDEIAELKKDVLITLHLLATVAMTEDKKPLGNPQEVSPQTSRIRELALELMLSVLNNVGPVFLKDESYLVVIKTKVCIVISKNSTTTNPYLFELSLSIFLLLIRYYRHKLKPEIQTQFVLYLQILEMGNSTYKQKTNILQGLLKITENPQLLMDIYLNYDCDFEATSIYEKMITLCSKITQGRGESAIVSLKGQRMNVLGFSDSKQEMAKQQDKRLFLRALCVLHSVIQSLVKWCQDIDEERERKALEDSRSRAASQSNNILVGKYPLATVSMDTNLEVDNSIGSEAANGRAGEIQSRKQQYKNALEQFNLNPKRGIKLFINGGFIKEDADEIASFLIKTPDLSKSAIGDYIGEGDAFFVSVMHKFVDSLDFAGLDFVSALRSFLQNFRLPGESQKIDRLMEKFADRYCELNPNIFAKADTAYTLAFSIIMLNTDQHSPEIKHRMDKAAFIRNNRGINDDDDLPDEFLGGIYDEISKNEIILEDEKSEKLRKMVMGWGAGEVDDKKRLETYRKEVAAMQKKNLSQTGGNGALTSFTSASSKELAKSMFSTAAWAIMAALSLSFEGAEQIGQITVPNSKEPDVVDLCLNGIVGSIKIACLFQLETEKDAFVTTLSRLTGLSHFYEIKEKNTKAITKLIELASSLGPSLDSAWIEIIKALSLLEKMQVAVLRGDPMMIADVEKKSDVDSPNGYQELVQNRDSQRAISKTLEDFVANVQSQNSIILIDRIFTNSVKLSAHSLIYFFTAVCKVALEEVGMDAEGTVVNTNPPRMYLLQKIVEIAYYNMHRIRFEWTQIWRILQPYFNVVACHPDIRVANFAVDSLRQMGMKFLEKDELGQFSTQHEYLKSFEFIIKQNKSPVIRELILNSLSQMITTRASRIKSGWKSIFVTLARAAQTDEKLAMNSFHIIQVIFNQNFEEVVTTGAFVDLVACLAECALLQGSGPAHDELVMSSIQMLQSCTKSLMERANNFNAEEEMLAVKPQPARTPSTITPNLSILRITNLPQQPYLLPNGCISEEHFYLSWFPILSAFSRVVTESDGVLVRTHTMEILFEIFKSCGHLFDAPYWKKISRNIVNPIFDDLNDPEASSRESNSAVMVLGLRLLVSLITEQFSLFFKLAKNGDNSSVEFLYSCIDRMVDTMTKPDEKLSSLGQTCFHQFLLLNASKFDDSTWIWVSSRIEKSFRLTMPIELIRCDVTGITDGLVPAKVQEAAKAASSHINLIPLNALDFNRVVLKCVTHKEMLLTLKEFCLMQVEHGAVIALMPEESRDILLNCVYSSYAVARQFNSMTALRQAIHKKGWVAQLPNLVDQETISFSTYLTALFRISKENKDPKYIQNLSQEIEDMFDRFVTLLGDTERNKQHIRSWSPILVSSLKELQDIKSMWFESGPLKSLLPSIYRYAVRMTTTENFELRAILIDLLLEIGERFFEEVEK